MKVIRYSIYGYKPQEQTHHMEHINYHLNGGFDINDYPEWIRWQIQGIHDKKVKFYTEHFNDFKQGIWCFVDGHKDNLSLNHLHQKVPCWEANVPNDIECYDCNWERLTTISDSIVLCGGCYIPERELWKIQDIRKRKHTA
jgi:hypothetical protein